MTLAAASASARATASAHASATTTTITASRPPSGPEQAPALPASSSLLLIDDDPGSVQVLSHMVAGLGQLRFALSGAQGLELARCSVPDVVLVDAEMPGMGGLEFCARMKADPMLAEVPVVIVTSHGDVETEVAGFAAGAADFIRKPPVAEVVRARVGTQLRLKALGDALRAAALIDGLTGVGNRRRFNLDLHAECERARRSGETLALLMVDADHFKAYNDRYGHLAGDGCLQQVAAALGSVFHRPADRLARYGGEEFALLLPHTELDGAARLARAAVDAVAALHIEHAGAPGGAVTVSVGVAAARRNADGHHVALSGQGLVDAADQALYAAKSQGRGRCAVYVPAPPVGPKP